MEYRAVGNRCAVDFRALRLPIPDPEILQKLSEMGFVELRVNLVDLARQCIRTSQYSRGARLSTAPGLLDCSSFIKWLYGQRGIWLPRRSIQQRECGRSVPIDDLSPGDVVFVSGRINYYRTDPSDGVGHVGLATGEGTIIHAANKSEHVIESSVDEFVGDAFRGARRYIPKRRTVRTFRTPFGSEIESSDDIRWRILQRC